MSVRSVKEIKTRDYSLKIQKNLEYLQKKEAALPQHYLSPNQIKPNYLLLFLFRSCYTNIRPLCKKYNYCC